MRQKRWRLAALLCCALLLSGCSGNPASPAAKERVVIFTAAEEERISYLQAELDARFPDIQVVIQSLGTGQLLSRLQAEGTDTACDIFYDLEVVNAEILLSQNEGLFADLSGYDFSIYDASVTGYTQRHHRYAVNGKTYGAFLVNTAVLAEKGLPVPTSYQDMLNPGYAGLIAMPSPKSSGTGYSYYNGMITLLGEAEGQAYFQALNPNIREYTTSGSAPAKAAVRGDVAIAYGLLWQCVQCAGENADLQVVVPPEGLAFDLFVMGMISGHDSRPAVKAVFDCLYHTLNQPQCARFNPDVIYASMPSPLIPGYPAGVREITMQGLYDAAYKQRLLDAWAY